MSKTQKFEASFDRNRHNSLSGLISARWGGQGLEHFREHKHFPTQLAETALTPPDGRHQGCRKGRAAASSSFHVIIGKLSRIGPGLGGWVVSLLIESCHVLQSKCNEPLRGFERFGSLPTPHSTSILILSFMAFRAWAVSFPRSRPRI